MSERFNFYDIYGYLIPGFALLGLLWLPLGIASGEAPNLGFADALGGLLVAYILGHILAGITKRVFPSGRRVASNDIRRPSDDLLDRSQNPNAGEYISRLETKIKDEFGIDLTKESLSEQERVELGREAFLMCRARLVLLRRGGYAEQFQGMYSMMRGVSVAGLVAAYYLLGWLASSARLGLEQQHGWSSGFPVNFALGGPFPVNFAWVLVLFAGLDVWATRSERTAAGPVQLDWPTTVLSFLVLAASRVGFLLGKGNPSLAARPGLIVALAAGAIFLANRCYGSNEYFARTFAETVYREFLALPKRVIARTSGARASR